MTFRTLMCLGIAASLSACVSILPNPDPAPKVYRLGSNFTAVDQSPAAELVRVDRATAAKVFSSTDIVVADNGQKLSVVAEANWAETTPTLIQSAMIDALSSSPRFIGLTSTSGASTETRLNLAIQNFEANFDNGMRSAPMAIVSYRVTYTDVADRELLGTFTARQTRRADSINVSSIVNAIEAANQAAMSDIVNWMETRQSRSGS